MQRKYWIGGAVAVFLIAGMGVFFFLLGGRSLFIKRPIKAAFTWIDDDTVPGAFENAHAIAEELGIKMTFACMTDNVTKESLVTLLDYQKEGYQVTTHSASHNNEEIWGSNYDGDCIFDREKAEEDLLTSIQFLKDAGFQNSDFFVSPGGVESDDVISLVSCYCPAMVVTQASGIMNTNEDIQCYRLHREFIDISACEDVSYYTDLIDQAITENAWLIFGTHSAMEEQWNEGLVREVMQYAVDSGIEIKTLDQAFEERKELFR